MGCEARAGLGEDCMSCLHRGLAVVCGMWSLVCVFCVLEGVAVIVGVCLALALMSDCVDRLIGPIIIIII